MGLKINEFYTAGEAEQMVVGSKTAPYEEDVRDINKMIRDSASRGRHSCRVYTLGSLNDQYFNETIVNALRDNGFYANIVRDKDRTPYLHIEW